MSQSVHYKPQRPMNPEEIVAYIHEEHTHYSQMDKNAQEFELARLIQAYADYQYRKKPIVEYYDKRLKDIELTLPKHQTVL